ncbi:hypothetical protein HPB47_023679 [Ixodes persulcatus]|uniref:Uncharacterized protein n=1 Tax=Ixodes persulcatus TaxID=34615 RepID=A0AC60Q869_IXOPE|nr:hypothetical protein HPB47_023679 [Ixodes persulcatus]
MGTESVYIFPVRINLSQPKGYMNLSHCVHPPPPPSLAGDAGMITSSSPANPSASRDQQPKTSPDGHDQTPSHDGPCSPKPGVVEDGSLLCSGCEIPIQERFYLQALDRPWHTGCLRCCRCGAGLDTQASCFAREGRIYCKDDYLRAFVRCCACGSALAPRDLVMRVRGVSFHVACFRCASCHCPLLKGDVFGMRDNRVFCRLHFLGHSPSGKEDGKMGS